MKFTGTTYRPPVEAMMGTELLQMTEGCVHNAFTLCTMYADNVPFYGIHPTNTSSIQGVIPRNRETIIGH